MSGVYDIDGIKGRSVLNKLNTNIIGFVILLHDINKAIKKMGEPEMTLVGKTPKEQIDEVNRFCKYIKKFQNRIFPSSNTLTNIMNVISKTHGKGESNEMFVNTLLKKKIGDENVKTVGKLGSEQDMSGGVDVILTIDGIDKTGQVKPIYSINKSQGEYVIKIKGFVKDYKTDLLIFTDNKKVYVFNNKNVDASGDHFKIPVDNLIYELD
jgi:hypothetical protein